MKRLLLCLTALFLSYVSHSQVPVNDLIANAIEIDPLNYVEENLRIDLATNSGTSAPSCGTSGFPDIYYKFTATSETSIIATLTDMVGDAITTSFVIFYSAPDLNQIDESQFSLVSPCSIGVFANTILNTGESYYIQVHRNDANAFSRFTVMEDVPQDVPESERDALIAFYNATGGDNWVNNSNWNTSAPVRTWFGINTSTTDIFGQPYTDGLEHVQSLSFVQFNNITGPLPSELANLTKLAGMNFINNPLNGTIPDYIYDYPQLLFFRIQNSEMSGTISPNILNATNLQSLLIDGNNFSGPIPDLTSLPAFDRFLFIQNNSFQFGDFEAQFETYQSTIDNFSWSPQKPIEAPENRVMLLGETQTFNAANVSGVANIYSWFKRDEQTGGGILISNDMNLNLTINSVDDYGAYWLEVTNTTVTGLALTSPDFFVSPQPTSSPDYPALVAFYNSTNGDDWNFNDNWLDNTKPLSDWVGVTTINNRVTELGISGNNITGVIPPEIGDLSELKVFGLQSNSLGGEIPESFWSLDLEEIFLNNTGGGNSTLSFTNTSNPTFANMPNLRNLFMSDISIPLQAANEISTLNNLEIIFLLNCELGPDLPEEWASIGALQLSRNNFEGAIPQAFETSASNFLDISNNFYDFSNLETIESNNNLGQFIYSPQRTRDIAENIESPPGLDITLDVDDTNIDRNAQDTALNNEYQWFKDENPISGANASTYTIFNAQMADSGVYFCQITNTVLPDLIIRRADITITIEDSLNTEVFENDSFGIFPNPAKNWLTIKVNQSKNTSMKLFDINGQLISEKELTTETTVLAIDQLSSGVYIISVSGNGINATKRFVKH